MVPKNLDGTNGVFVRKKREDGNLDWDLDEHVRTKRAVQHTSYYPMLLPEFELYGIKPSGGELKAATSCVCSKKPSSKVRKSLDMYVSWNDSLKDLRSRKSPPQSPLVTMAPLPIEFGKGSLLAMSSLLRHFISKVNFKFRIVSL